MRKMNGEFRKSLFTRLLKVLTLLICLVQSVVSSGQSDFDVYLPPHLEACAGTSITSPEPQIIGGSAPFTYTWYEDGDIISEDPEITVIAGELQVVTLVLEDSNGQIDSVETSFSAYPIIPAEFNADNFEGCDPWMVPMQSVYTGYQNVSEMLWIFGDGDSISSMASVNHEYTDPGVYFPILRITDEYGCVSMDSLDVPVRIFPTPNASFTVDHETAYLPDSRFEFSNTSYEGEDYYWIFDEYGTNHGVSPDFTFPDQEATYKVELFASNQYGCIDSTSRYVSVIQSLDFFIPNSFTPDGDGINDVWKVEGIGFQTAVYQACIFNRWGEKLFESLDPSEAWTGNMGGGSNFVPDGIYFYRIHLRDTENAVGHVFNGQITVIR